MGTSVSPWVQASPRKAAAMISAVDVAAEGGVAAMIAAVDTMAVTGPGTGPGLGVGAGGAPGAVAPGAAG